MDLLLLGAHLHETECTWNPKIPELSVVELIWEQKQIYWSYPLVIMVFFFVNKFFYLILILILIFKIIINWYFKCGGYFPQKKKKNCEIYSK
jgi:hypothetical protein